MSELTVCFKGEHVHLLKCLDPKEAARIAIFSEECWCIITWHHTLLGGGFAQPQARDDYA
jgi:hypothetical protein